jgi:apolipoprotein N-acyltransferase
VLAGLGIGMASVPDPGAWRDVAITSLGSWFGICYFTVIVIGGVVAALDRWPGRPLRIALGVLASWLVAMAALYLAFVLVGTPPAADPAAPAIDENFTP